MLDDVLDRLARALDGAYAVERRIGSGGMATVYLARDVRHGRRVALKVLHAELSAVIGPERFLKEIELTASLQHPNILPLFDSGDADGLLYYVMPYVDGETLRARLERETQLPVDDALRLATETADALAYAHALGVVHRDIKPENILLQGAAGAQHALVADFGIALAVQQAGGQRMTQTGLSLGTPQYMAPEQAMGEKAVDARADQYALGAVTYEMLAGEPPFTGPSAQAIIARVLTADPPPLATARRTVPEPVARAVHRALQKLPADRFTDIRAFALALNGGASDSSHDALAASHNARTSTRVGRVLAWLVPAFAAGALIGWAIATRTAGAAAEAPAALAISSLLPPTGGSLAQRRSIALTPDGTQLAFVIIGLDGGRTLWLRRLDEPEAVPLSGTAGADVPFWSPDGRTLGFFSDGYLMLRDPSGTVRRVCPAADATSASWGAKNVIVFTHRLGISTVGGNESACRLVVPRGAGTLLKAALLPDGGRFVYSLADTDSLRIATLDGQTVKVLPLRARDLQLAPPHWLAVSSEQDARGLDLVEMDWRTLEPRGTPVRLLSDMRSSGGEFSLTFGGDMMVYHAGSIDLPYLEFDEHGVLRDSVHVSGTWTIDAHREAGGAVRVALGGNLGGLWLYETASDRVTRLTVGDSGRPVDRRLGGVYPTFSRDGSRLAYMVQRATGCDVVVRELKTDVERTAVRIARSRGVCPKLMQWSVDERAVVAEVDSVVKLVPLDGSPATTIVARPGRLWDARISPDGHAIAYSSDEGGRAEIYVRVIEGGTPARVSTTGGRWPVWGATNGMLYFLSPSGQMMVARVANTRTATVDVPRALFSVGTATRGIFTDRGTGFAMLGNGERFFVRQSPSALTLTIVRPWTRLIHRADTASAR